MTENPSACPSTYIVIPVHNRKVTTLNCLQHLQTNGDLQRYQVVIVDDGSTDGTADAVRAAYPEVVILQGDGTLWWTGGTAMGMEYAYRQGAKFIIWMNDDCMPLPGTLPGLVDFMQAHPNALAAPACYAGELNESTIQHNGFQNRRGCAAKPGERLEVDGMSGWCVGMPATVVSQVGLPDTQRFPHYSGDDMYTLRATRAGFKAYLIGDLPLVLFGPVHARLHFKDYFRPGQTPAQILTALFWDKKSPYRLSTRFFVFIERYGFLAGLPLFLAKLMTWSWQYSKLQLEFWCKPDRFSVRNSV